jgi:hypothetical protein
VLSVRDELAALKAAASEVASRAEAVLAVAPAVEEVLRGG